MKRLLDTKAIQARYSCSPATARKYMRSMEHQENPLRVTETAVEAWEQRRTFYGSETGRQADAPRKLPRVRQKPADGFLISRRRPA